MSPTATLRLSQIGKQFFGVPVLSDIHLNLSAGQVMGLIGENGAGKSTLMNICGGLLQPDRGHLRLAGQPYAPRDAAEAAACGIAIVHQELNLFPNLTVAENLLLTDFPGLGTRRGRTLWINRKSLVQQAHAALARVGLEVSPDERLERLSPGQRQLVEIAKALRQQAKVMLFDEPTTSLTTREAERLFEIIRDLKQRGMAIVYISHNLNDVRQLCDSIVVLRDGQIQADGPANDFELDQLIALMVGRQISQIFPNRPPIGQGAPLFQVAHLTQPGVVRDIGFDLQRGEVLGLSGLMGAGRTELARMLFGLEPFATGQIWLDGKPFDPTPRRCISHGMALVTENRREDGLLLEASILDNAVLAALPRFANRVSQRFRSRQAVQAVSDVADQMHVSFRSLTRQPVMTLSGGNQQKVVIGKWLLTQPRMVILDEPTRGIDVGAKVEIYRLINQLAQTGTGILIISSELEELVGLCDRILVMAQGEIRSEVTRDQFDREHLLREAFGKERLA